MPDSVVFSGWLEKKGDDAIGAFKKRFFSLLSDNTLRYYTNELGNSKAQLKGSIQVSNIDQIRISSLRRKKYLITLETPGRVYILAASDGKTQSDWVVALRRARARSDKSRDKSNDKKESREQDLLKSNEKLKREVSFLKKQSKKYREESRALKTAALERVPTLSKEAQQELLNSKHEQLKKEIQDLTDTWQGIQDQCHDYKTEVEDLKDTLEELQEKYIQIREENERHKAELHELKKWSLGTLIAAMNREENQSKTPKSESEPEEGGNTFKKILDDSLTQHKLVDVRRDQSRSKEEQIAELNPNPSLGSIEESPPIRRDKEEKSASPAAESAVLAPLVTYRETHSGTFRVRSVTSERGSPFTTSPVASTALAPIRCQLCLAKIKGDEIVTDGSAFHRSCFTCLICHCELTLDSAVVTDLGPFCLKHGQNKKKRRIKLKVRSPDSHRRNKTTSS